jgi:predicted transcriptional regulator
MTFLYSNKNSPKLKASIIEPILLLCINGISIYELPNEIQRMVSLPLPCKIIKKYLFYLISYGLISYKGQRQIYITEDGGLDLLYRIHQEKQNTFAISEDITITLE